VTPSAFATPCSPAATNQGIIDMKRNCTSRIADMHNRGEIAARSGAHRTIRITPSIALGFTVSCGLAFVSDAQAASPSFTTLYTFTSLNADNGEIPMQLAFAGGKLYGIANEGGAMNVGTLFEYNIKRNSMSAPVQFGLGDTGGNPIALNAFGKTLIASTLYGTVYDFDTTTQTGQTIYQFPGGNTGAYPGALQLVNGNLYGTALVGRNDSNLFGINISTGIETTLYEMTGWTGGGAPNGQLVYQNGVLYGAVAVWKNYQVGGIFSYDLATGAEKVIYHFNTRGKDGAQPIGVTYCNGLLYGVNYGGGSGNQGNVFSYDLATGVERTLYSFNGQTDGIGPSSGPICSGNSIYGTTWSGGANNYGMVYAVDRTTGKETILHSFAGTDGAYADSLTVKDGILYGTTEEGPDGNGGLALTGTIFQVIP
jgi:uncharacterized repeat protein (TIGR03803 family)